jgi:hypothetical protein
MVVNNLDIFWPIACPHKAYAKLIVNADTVLSNTTVFQCLQPVAGWYAQIIKNASPVKLFKFSTSNRFNIHKSPYALPLEQALGFGALERLDGHA